MTAPDTRAEVERSWIDKHGDVWRLGEDGLMHTPETAPFPREHVEKKWGPLREVADAGLLADTRPAEPAQGEQEALADLLDDLVCARGVVLDDSRLEWITDALLADGWTRTAPNGGDES